MTTTPPPAPADLRNTPVDRVLDRVEGALEVRLDRSTMVRKRRSVGARSDRDTWVRVERRPVERIGGQGWNGTETAEALQEVAKPVWWAALVWRDAVEPVMWRADETELLPDAPVKAGGTLMADPGLPPSWWAGLNSSLDALAAHRTTRVATPDTVTVTQTGVTEAITATFGPMDTRISHWAPAHADLNWANVTGPQFCLFDWEDWGTAPRGLDAASLWGNSLAVPELAERVRRERHEDLESRDGLLMRLFFCSKIVGRYADASDPLLEPARREAERTMARLQPR